MSRSFIQITIISIVLSLPYRACAQLYCQNQTQQEVWLSLAYNYIAADADISNNIWITEGWFYIPAGGTVQLASHIGYDKGKGIKTNFFFYAYQPGGRDWNGSRRFIIDYDSPRNTQRLSFKVEYANQTSAFNDYPNLREALFKKGTNTQQKQHTLILRQDDENDPPYKQELLLRSYFKTENDFGNYGNE